MAVDKAAVANRNRMTENQFNGLDKETKAAVINTKLNDQIVANVLNKAISQSKKANETKLDAMKGSA